MARSTADKFLVHPSLENATKGGSHSELEQERLRRSLKYLRLAVIPTPQSQRDEALEPRQLELSCHLRRLSVHTATEYRAYR